MAAGNVGLVRERTLITTRYALHAVVVRMNYSSRGRVHFARWPREMKAQPRELSVVFGGSTWTRPQN